jgi:acetyl esterase/lipase
MKENRAIKGKDSPWWPSFRWTLILFLVANPASAQGPITRPAIPESVSAVEAITVRAEDEHDVVAVVRKPPGVGPFPAVIAIHGTVPTLSLDALTEQALTNPTFTRLLAAGYVTVIPTYRTEWGDDPQTPEALWDNLAVVEHVKRMEGVDPTSVVVYGCSGGGDVALQIAGETALAAITAEEPATILFTGMFTSDVPRAGARYGSVDVRPLLEDPHAYFGDHARNLTRERIGRISSPVLIAQGDVPFYGVDHHKMFNEILIPELRAAGKDVEQALYPGQRHCFGFEGGLVGRWTTDATVAAARDFFNDMDAFFRLHLDTQPVELEDSALQHVLVR